MRNRTILIIAALALAIAFLSSIVNAQTISASPASGLPPVSALDIFEAAKAVEAAEARFAEADAELVEAEEVFDDDVKADYRLILRRVEIYTEAADIGDEVSGLLEAAQAEAEEIRPIAEAYSSATWKRFAAERDLRSAKRKLDRLVDAEASFHAYVASLGEQLVQVEVELGALRVWAMTLCDHLNEERHGANCTRIRTEAGLLEE